MTDTMEELLKLERQIQEASVRSALARRRYQDTYDVGHVYVVEFDSGILKVGRTTKPESRLAAHGKAAPVVGFWVSARHLDHSATERRLIAFCARRGVLTGGKEYFRGIDLELARDFAGVLVDHAVSPAIARAADSDLALVNMRREYRDWLAAS